MITDTVYKRLKIVEICLFFCACFVAASTMDITHAPDEAMRYPIARFIYQNGALPNGMEDSLINQTWGFSYAMYPYLTSIISAFFMKIVSVFASSDTSLLIAARLTSVLSGTGALILCFRIGEQIFDNRSFSLLFSSLICFLPQFIFLCSYQNNDSFAVFCGALIIYFWTRALKTGWSMRSCIGLGIGCGLCALSYYTAYIYLLATLILYFVDRIRKKDSSVDITGKALVILVIAFAIAGWFFIRNAMLHNGDILGFRTTTLSAEKYAMDGFHPDEIPNPKHLGWSIPFTFLKTKWLPTVLVSFVGVFSYMSVFMPLFIYVLYYILLFSGFIGFVTRPLGKKPASRSSFPPLVLICFIVMIFMNIFLFMYNVYTSDYQAQGRYMMPSLLPIMLFVTEGFRTFSRRFSARLIDPAADRSIRLAEIKKRDDVLCAALIIAYVVLCLISYFGYLIPGCRL